MHGRMNVMLWISAVVAALGSSGCDAELDGVDAAVSATDRYLALDRSAAGLAAYAEGARELHNDAAALGDERVLTTITLARPLAPDAAVALLKRHSIEVWLVQAFARGEVGEVVTIGTRVTGVGQLDTIAQDNGAALIGVVAVFGEVAAAALPAVAADPAVFAADISGDERFSNSPSGPDPMPSVAWDLLHLPAQ